ncbi:MAG: metal ABC transporter permease [Halorhodospira sp.]
MDAFILTALAAGIGLALVTGPLGCFVVWRRMAYFGETLAHSALLGVAVGFLFGISLNVGILVVCLLVAALLVLLRRYQRLASDTVLGILAHSALSLGLVAIAFMEGLRVDLMGYLFGDILAVTFVDLYWIYGGGALVLGALIAIWRPLLNLTLHEEMAQVEGVPVLPVQMIFMGLVAVTIALAMQIVGILLVISMLIIPAATAGTFARTPEQMAVMAALAGGVAVVGGVSAAFQWDLPTGPAIVVTATALFSVMTGARGALGSYRAA